MGKDSRSLRKVRLQEAVGRVLGHDVTEIVPGRFKGRAFKKGHVVREEDLEHLLRLGKEHLFVLNLQDGVLHEDEAARRIARAAAGRGLELSDPCEGRITMHAVHDGLLKIDVQRLDAVNALESITLATLHTDQEVASQRPVAGTRVVPLVIEEEAIRAVEAVCAGRRLIEVLPFQAFRVGMVTTGSEVYHGRIEDSFGPVVRRKLESLGCSVTRQVLVSDDMAMTVSAIVNLAEEGADMIVVTGGMSVDPDDLSPSAIRAAGGEVVTYGAPVFPGAMFMLAYRDGVPILGLPGCVMYFQASIFDLVVPRLAAGDRVGREDIVRLGHGGLCAGCSPCRYPACAFGKR